MTIVVVDEAEGVVVIFGGEYAPESVRTGKAEGVVGGEGVVGNGGGRDGAGNGAEGGIVIVCCDAIARFEVDEFRDVLIAIKGIEELVASWIRKHEEWTCRHGFGWVPNEEI